MSTTTQERTQERPGAASFRKFVHYTQEHKELPNEHYNGNMGDFLSYVTGLIGAYNEHGYTGFENVLDVLQRNETLVNIALSMSDTKQEEEQDPRLTTGKKGKKVFRTLSMDDIDDLPDTDDLVRKILQTTTTSLLFGDSNTGKTFLGLHIAFCVAYGMAFFGRQVKQGRVLYIYAEGKLGLKPRKQAWCKYHARQSTDAIRFIAVPVHLIHDRQFLLDTIAEQEETYSLVVIDTFSNCSIGTNQNDQMEVAKVLTTAHDIVREYKAHVLVVHHTNNTGKFNGSAAFRNHVDTMIELSQSDALSPIVMRCEKQRDMERFKDIRLELEVIELGINSNTLEPVTSCVMKLSENTTDKGLPPIQQAVIDALGKDELTYSQWEKKALEADVKKASFDTARKAVIKRGLVLKTADEKRYYQVNEEGQSNA